MSKTATYTAALARTREKREAAAQKKRARKVKRRPWAVLMEEWFEEMAARFPGVKVSPWGEAEKKLCRTLVREEGFDDALAMVRRFVRGWDRDGLPGFKLLWTMRDTLRAEVKGQLKTRRERVDRDEFNADRAKDCPAIGW